MSNKTILLDLFYQCTDYQSADVDWAMCQEGFDFNLDYAILYVKMKSGEYISVTNQSGNVHVSVTHPDGTTKTQYNP